MIEGFYDTGLVMVNNRRLTLEHTLGLITHPVERFTWGEEHCSRLALALLLRLTNEKFARDTFQLFATHIVSRIPAGDFTMETVHIRAWARDNGWKGDTDGHF